MKTIIFLVLCLVVAVVVLAVLRFREPIPVEPVNLAPAYQLDEKPSYTDLDGKG